MRLFNFSLGLCIILCLSSCGNDSSESESIVLQNTGIDLTIDGINFDGLSFNCTNAPTLFETETRTENNTNQQFHSQGYSHIPLSDMQSFSFKFISYDFLDIRLLDAEGLREYIKENQEFLHFDFELKDNDTVFRNQFYIPGQFGERTVVAENENLSIQAIETVEFDCTDNLSKVSVSINYSSVIKTEDGSAEKSINIGLLFHLEARR